MSETGSANFPVVGLGGSAGGLQAFFDFFGALAQAERPPPMAFVVVLHLPRDEVSHLPELLRKRTDLPVRDLEASTEVAANVVYVLPPNRTLTAADRSLELRERADGRAHHPVDDLFTALASAFEERSVAIVCSGTGSNGSTGVMAVREAGGCVIAQAPETAEFDEMPRHAMETGAVDLVVPPASMIEPLIKNALRLRAGAGRREGPESAPREASAEGEGTGLPTESASLNRILATLRSRTSLDFRQYKPGTLQRRIERRRHFLGAETLEQYAEILREKPEEAAALASDLLITVTGFFRDASAWQALEERAIAPLVAGHPEDEALRTWVAGCATGEEAYSVTICLLEAMQRQERRIPIEVFATDASQSALSRARGGDYAAASIQHLSPERQRSWFRAEGDRVRIRSELREPMVFAPQDLIQDPPFSRAHLVVCRNVLIYLQAEIQRKLIRLFHFALREGGYLFLGNSESIGDATDLFEVVDKSARIYRRVGPTRHDLVEFPVMRTRKSHREQPPALSLQPKRPAGQIFDQALKALLDRHAPPSVVIDQGFSVLYYQGATERFLRPQTGEATHSLLALARDSLAPHIRRAIEAARRSGAVETVSLRAPLDGGLVPTRIEAAPVPGKDGMLLVSFVEGNSAGQFQEDRETQGSPRESELEDEVRLLREEIQALATSSSRAEEEFKAYHEEITSMNEELRATNEELETSKEELQSLNEELSTLNHQLRTKVEELRERTSDLQNLLSSTDVATLFLDQDLRVRWFSPSLARLFHIHQADIQRPVSHLVRQFADDALEEECRGVLRTLAQAEAQVEAGDGRTFIRRISPYRTDDDRIAGAVITFSDVTGIEEARRFAERVAETVPTPFLVLDTEMRVRSANPAFYRTFDVRRDETDGCLIFELGNRQWDIPELRRLLNEVLPDDGQFENYEVEHDFQGIGRKTMLLNGRRLDHVQLILLAVEDITERNRAGEHQAMLMAELAHRVKNALAVVQGLASQTLRKSRSLDEFQSAFSGRLRAYARSHDQLMTRDWRQGDVGELIASAVEAHAIESARVRIEGPAIEVAPRQALALGLVLHELETNAAKYGALSNETGTVDIRWAVDEDEVIELLWEETGGPPIEPPENDGFGSTLIRQLVQFELAGTVEMSFERKGLLGRITFPYIKPGGPEGSLERVT